MATIDGLAPAVSALDDCDDALRKLDAGCCEPGRSPRMKALAETLTEARAGIARLEEDGAAAPALLATLEEAGSQVGRLQVGCCTPKRMPLYGRILEGLTTVQITVAKALGQGH